MSCYPGDMVSITGVPTARGWQPLWDLPDWTYCDPLQLSANVHVIDRMCLYETGLVIAVVGRSSGSFVDNLAFVMWCSKRGIRWGWQGIDLFRSVNDTR